MSKLQGTITAMTTPFASSKRAVTPPVDYPQFQEHVELQIAGLVDGLVVLGTTAEANMLKPAEKKNLVRIARDAIDASGKDIKLIVGTGEIDTRTVFKNTKWAKDAGADIAMVVSPPYVKPNKSGMIGHYETIAKAGLPILMYSVKSRTGGNGITFEMYQELVKIPQIIGTKEASGNLPLIKSVTTELGPKAANSDFAVLSGDDSATYEIMKFGGTGVVSVISNLVPGKVKGLTDAMLAKDEVRGKEISNNLSGLAEAAFWAGSPMTIKYMMQYTRLVSNSVCRLPLGPIEAEDATKLDDFMYNFYWTQMQDVGRNRGKRVVSSRAQR